MPRAGMLRDRIAFERPVKTTSSSGEVQTEWEQVGDTLPANVQQARGSNYFSAAQVSGRSLVTVTIRYRSGVRSDWRIKWMREDNDYQYLDIAAPPADPNGRRTDLEILTWAREVGSKYNEKAS